MEERLYDLIFIARPATAEEDVKESAYGYRAHLHGKGREIEKAETWGTRKLAYKVAKHREGMILPADSHFASGFDRGAGAAFTCAGYGH